MSDNEELTRLRRENEYLKNEVVKLSRYKLRHILCGMRDRCYRKLILPISIMEEEE